MIAPNVWLMQSQRDIDGLIVALRSELPVIRKEAAVALRRLDAVEAAPALEAALAREQNWQVVASLSAAVHHLKRGNRLAELIAAGDVPGLINMLYSPVESEIVAAARTLGKLGDLRAVEPLVILFRSPGYSDNAKYFAAEALIELKSAPATVTLLAALRKDDWQVRRNAAAVLGQLKAAWAVPGLAKTLNDEHPHVRRMAEVALRAIGTPAARQALEALYPRARTVFLNKPEEDDPAS